MTVGESIKRHRTEAGLTQKDLSDKLNVSFQTVSKWENDTNEPDISTIKEMCKIFNCSFEDLVDPKDDTEKVEVKEEITPIVIPVIKNEPSRIQIGHCRDCGKTLYSDDVVHHMLGMTDGVQENVLDCDECFQIHQALEKEREELLKPVKLPKKEAPKAFSKLDNRPDKKLIIWAAIISFVALAIALTICLCNYENVGIGWTIGGPLIAAYIFFADVYCIFSASWVSDVFMSLASFSIRFPGIIFTWDLEGLAFLIIMKLLFFVLGILIGIGAFLFAFGFSSICAIFTFPFLIIYNKTHYREF